MTHEGCGGACGRKGFHLPGPPECLTHKGQRLLQGAIDAGAHWEKGRVEPGASGSGCFSLGGLSASLPAPISWSAYLSVCLALDSCSSSGHSLSPHPKEPCLRLPLPWASTGARPCDPSQAAMFIPVQILPSGGCGWAIPAPRRHGGQSSRKRESGPNLEGEARFQRAVEVLAQGMLEMSTGDWPAWRAVAAVEWVRMSTG